MNFKLFKYLIIFILFYLFLSQSDSNLILGCGLFAFVGSDPKKHFNWLAFNVLGTFNDTRGGDACGIVSQNTAQLFWDTGFVHYKDQVSKRKINFNLFQIKDHIFGHTRKASSGGSKQIYTQPMLVTKGHPACMSRLGKDKQYRNWVKELRPHTIVFSGIHNGTIYNSKELASKYKISVETKNDTQILFEILYKENFKVLEEYIGTASLIFYDHYKELTYIWRGESSTYPSVSVLSEERPLYMWEIDDSNKYFSSIEDSLAFIGAEKIEEVPANTLLIIKDGKIIESKEFSRKEASQRENYNTSSYVAPNNDEYSHYYHNKYPNNRSNSIGFKNSKTTCSITATETTKSRYLINPNKIQLAYENCAYFAGKRAIVYCKGRYWLNGKLMTGIYPINGYGCIPYHSKMDDLVSKCGLYYFIEGIMIDDMESYFMCKKIYRALLEPLQNKTKGEEITFEEVKKLEVDLLENLGFFTKHNVIDTLFQIKDTEMVKTVDKGGYLTYYTGTNCPTFSRRVYRFSNGDLKNIESNQSAAFTSHAYEEHRLAIQYYDKVLGIYPDRHFSGKEDLMDSIGRVCTKTKDNDIEMLNTSFFTSVILDEIPLTFSTYKSAEEKASLEKTKIIYYRTFFTGNDCLVCDDCEFADEYGLNCLECIANLFIEEQK